MIDDGDNPDPAPLTSCTRDEAIGMMLGLISGPEQAWPMNDDATPDELEIIYSHMYYLQGDLFEHKESLESDLAEAKADKLPEDVITEKRVALEKFKALDKKARIYLCQFDDEIAKGEKSELRIDQQATGSSSVTRFTLYSVDQWASKNHGISILEPLKSPLVTNNQSAQQDLGQGQESGPKRPKGPKDWLSRVKADNLYTSFAFLVEAFSQTADKYGKKAGKPNVSAIAEHIENLALEASKLDKVSGQDYETIKSCIEDAMKIKKAKLPKA